MLVSTNRYALSVRRVDWRQRSAFRLIKTSARPNDGPLQPQAVPSWRLSQRGLHFLVLIAIVVIGLRRGCTKHRLVPATNDDLLELKIALKSASQTPSCGDLRIAVPRTKALVPLRRCNLPPA
jgi:hypothetical protein